MYNVKEYRTQKIIITLMWVLRLAFEVWDTDNYFLLGTHIKHLNVKEVWLLVGVTDAVSNISWKKTNVACAGFNGRCCWKLYSISQHILFIWLI